MGLKPLKRDFNCLSCLQIKFLYRENLEYVFRMNVGIIYSRSKEEMQEKNKESLMLLITHHS